MITSITLERFRGFQRAELPLKPLTVLLGPNSAGKSSFLQALASLHFIRRLSISPATLAPSANKRELWPLDFGSRATLLWTGAPADAGAQIALGGRDTSGREYSIAYEFGGVGANGSLALSALEIVEKATPVVPAAQAIDATGGAHVTYTAPVAIEAYQGNEVALTANRISVRQDAHQKWWDQTGQQIKVTPKNLELEFYGRLTGTVVNVTSQAQQSLLEDLQYVRYLRPGRGEPLREYPLREPTVPSDDVGPYGQWAGETWLERMQGPLVVLRRPPPQRLDREVAARILAKPKADPEAMSFDAAVDFWMDHIGMARSAAAERRPTAIAVQVNVDGHRRDIADVGFGVSQVLPVVVQGLALHERGTFLIEQPEGQLHPRPQAGLADFLCALVEQGRRCVVETHSEALFRRLHLRALLDPALAEQIAVYFIDPVGQDGCCQPQPVSLAPDESIPWPKDFLADTARGHAAYAAVRAAMTARNAKG